MQKPLIIMNSLKHCSIFKTFNDEFYKNNSSKIRLACVYLRNEALIVDDRDNVYNIVNNSFTKEEVLCGKKVIDFAYAYSNINKKFGYHIIALTQEGEIYGWGRNTYNQVSIREADEILKPERLRIITGPCQKLKRDMVRSERCGWLKNVIRIDFVRFTKIAIGLGHCMAVTTDNEIFLWGNNKYGQMGNGRRSFIENAYRILIYNKDILIDTDNCFPCKQTKTCSTVIEHQSKIKSIACGSFHSLVLFENGDVYGWGNNELGQLGVIPNDNHLTPVRILSNIEKIVAVNLHTLALTKDGILYAMGDNSYAQIANDNKSFHTVPVKFDMRFSDIATINGISMGISKEDEKTYIWGLYQRYIITEPIEMGRQSFNKIVAQCLSLTYYCFNNEVEEVDDEDVVIDFSSFKTIEDSKNDEEVNERLDDHENQIEYIKGRVHKLEKNKNSTYIENLHVGDKVKNSVCDDLVVSNGTVNIEGIKQAGKSN